METRLILTVWIFGGRSFPLSWSISSCRRFSLLMPALERTAWIMPKAFQVCWKSSRTSSHLETSHFRKITRLPELAQVSKATFKARYYSFNSSASDTPSISFQSPMDIFAPYSEVQSLRHNICKVPFNIWDLLCAIFAVSRPMPEEAPVIKTVFPSRATSSFSSKRYVVISVRGRYSWFPESSCQHQVTPHPLSTIMLEYSMYAPRETPLSFLSPHSDVQSPTFWIATHLTPGILF